MELDAAGGLCGLDRALDLEDCLCREVERLRANGLRGTESVADDREADPAELAVAVEPARAV